MAKIMIFNVAHHGHLNPTLPVTEELVARAEDVTYVGPFEMERAIRATGASFVGFQSTLGQLSMPPIKPGGGFSWQMPRIILEDASASLPALIEATRAARPDIIAYDPLNIAGRIIAEV